MHKKIALLLTYLFLISAAHAGPGDRLIRQLAMRNPKAVTRVLTWQAEASFKKAVAKLRRQDFDLLTREYPADQFSAIRWNEENFRAKDAYPDVPFLTTAEQADLYMRRNINREIIKDASLHTKLRNSVLDHLEDFERAQVQISHEQEEDAAWLAKQIPQDTLYLLVGETHGMTEVQPALNTLIRTLRAQQPERKIFLFTELIFHESHRVVNEFYEKFFTEISSDEALNVPVIGLDMEITDLPIPMVGELGHSLNAVDIWSTREGVRIRNNYWLKILKKYRAENPDALFIVYGGKGHMGYTYPYSMGQLLQKTFVIMYTPKWRSTVFDKLSNRKFIKARVLQFNDKALSRLAGFDVQIRGKDLFE